MVKYYFKFISTKLKVIKENCFGKIVIQNQPFTSVYKCLSGKKNSKIYWEVPPMEAFLIKVNLH